MRDWKQSKAQIGWGCAVLLGAALGVVSQTIAHSDADAIVSEQHIPVPLPGAPGDGMIVEKNVMVPMRDGVRLATDIYRPAGAGKYPVVLMRTPYGSEGELSGDFSSPGLFYVKRGYAFAIQDCRGKYDSEGEWHGKRSEAQDGSDTITWLGTRPWSSGSVGMTGGSYLGMVQYWVADQENPYLKALVPMVAPVTLGRDIAEYDHNANGWGRESSSYSLLWMLMTDGRVNQADGMTLRRDGAQSIGAADTSGFSYWGGRKHLPPVDYPKVLGRPMAWLPFVSNQRLGFWEEYHLRASVGEWSKPIAVDDWWKSHPERYRKVRVPMRHISGWFDCCYEPQLKMFQLVRKHALDPIARDNQQLVMGPWTHAVGSMKEVGMDLGPEAPLDMQQASVEWFDRWLEGKQDGARREPAVRVFVMGENRWREADDWPIPGTRFTKYYLHSSGDARLLHGGGGLSTRPPAKEPADRYTYDPADPTPAMLGDGVTAGSSVPGIGERTTLQSRSDVLVYTSERLRDPVEVTGPLSATVYVATSAPSTDLFLRLIDVHPDGKAYNMSYAYANPYRTHWAKEVESAADGTRIIKAEITLPSTSVLFRAGHRIRVEIASAAAPRFRGLNVEPGTEPYATRWNVAEQTIYHDKAHPSHIVLPVIPRDVKFSAARQ